MEMDVLSHPKENSRFVGHIDAEKALLSAFNNGTMPHAWLFSGPKGIGKASLAYRFARFVLANSAHDNLFADGDISSLDVDKEHPAFSKIASGSHSDLMVLETGYDSKTDSVVREIKVDDVRRITKFFQLTSSETPYRIVIIDSVDEMNVNAANSILKLLEEPPANSLLLLVCHSLGNVLPTIKSRCRHLRMNPLDEGVLTDWLSGEVGVGNKDEIEEIIALSKGSPGMALMLHYANGVEIYTQILTVLAHMPRVDLAEIERLAEIVVVKDSAVPWQLFGYLLEFFLYSAVALKRFDPAFSGVVGKEDVLFKRIQLQSGLEKQFEICEKVTGAIQDSERYNLQKKVVILNVFNMLATLF